MRNRDISVEATSEKVIPSSKERLVTVLKNFPECLKLFPLIKRGSLTEVTPGKRARVEIGPIGF